MEWATVLTSRAPERVDELDLNAGEFVRVLQKFGDEWFKGSIRGHVGLAPMTHVKIHRHLFPVRVEHPYDAQLPDELNLTVGDVISVLDDDLEDAGWWLGEVGGKVGLFPNNFVEKVQTTPLNHAVIRKKARSSVMSSVPQNNLYEEINQSGPAPSELGDTAVRVRSKTPIVETATAEEVRDLKEELAKIRFSFEWFSMRHAKTVSQLVDEIDEGKKTRKRLESEISELSMMAAHRFD